MPDHVETRPSNSDYKSLYRRVRCQKCGGEHWHTQTGPHEWTCLGCGAVFWQNPWVTDGHELIRAPIYDDQGDEPCLVTNQARNRENAQPVKVTETVPIATASAVSGATLPETALPALAQASFL